MTLPFIAKALKSLIKLIVLKFKDEENVNEKFFAIQLFDNRKIIFINIKKTFCEFNSL